MAKLSKMEISAIASKIVDDIANEVAEHNAKLTSQESFEKWMKTFKTTSKYKSLLALNKIKESFNKEFDGVKYKGSYNGTFNVKSSIIEIDVFCKQIFAYEFKIKEIRLSQNEIERDIIIAQAKNEDLDALIASLTEKYSK